MIGGTKTQGIEQCNWSRAHGENVTQNTANTGRRTLIGFNIGRVIVALDLEDGG